MQGNVFGDIYLPKGPGSAERPSFFLFNKVYRYYYYYNVFGE